jgi:hypothetical protein
LLRSGLALVIIFHLGDRNFQDNRLAFRNEGTLTAGQCAEERKFQPLHRCFKPSQRLAIHGDLMRCENQPKALFVTLGCQFSKDKLVEREEERMPRRNLNA